MHNQFTHALLRHPASTAHLGLTTRDGSPDFSLTLSQYGAYQRALHDNGLTLTILPADDRYPDGHYIEDTAVLFRDLAFITNPGAESRRGEIEAIQAALPHRHQIRLEGDAHLDGGDVLFCADRVLIGLSGRTNRAGADQLHHALQSIQADLRVDFVPFSGLLHLKSGLTELTPGILLRSPYLHTDFSFDFAEVITLPVEEEYAADVLPINDSILIPDGYPMVRGLAEKFYDRVFAIPMSEFAKMDGGLTCLSLRYTLS